MRPPSSSFCTSDCPQVAASSSCTRTCKFSPSFTLRHTAQTLAGVSAPLSYYFYYPAASSQSGSLNYPNLNLKAVYVVTNRVLLQGRVFFLAKLKRKVNTPARLANLKLKKVHLVLQSEPPRVYIRHPLPPLHDLEL